MKYLFFLTTILCTFWAINGKAQSKSNKEINDYIEKVQKQYNIPGLALAIIKNGEVIHKKTMGLQILNCQYLLLTKHYFHYSLHQK